MQRVTVAIPVGPSEGNKRWLNECLQSVVDQTYPVDEVLLIDDGANLEDMEGIRIWKTPWQSGVPHAFNFGVGLAKNELVFLLGSDDYLHLDCIKQCVKAWEDNRKLDAYYYVGVEYLDDRENKRQFNPCNAAMVTKGFWEWCGGFPPESASGACDAALISCLWGSNHLVCVNGSKPLYYYRSHGESDTSHRAAWQGVILETRDILTKEFKSRAK